MSGRVYDLILVEQPEKLASIAEATLEDALFESGRPVMMVPKTMPPVLGETIAIAWNGSTETAMTVALSMPFLKLAKHVVVVAVGPQHMPEPGPTGDELARNLEAHGLSVSLRTAFGRQKPQGESFLKEAMAGGADLLLKGAYTQSRIRQMIFGGATRHIIMEFANSGDHGALASRYRRFCAERFTARYRPRAEPLRRPAPFVRQHRKGGRMQDKQNESKCRLAQRRRGQQNRGPRIQRGAAALRRVRQGRRKGAGSREGRWTAKSASWNAPRLSASATRTARTPRSSASRDLTLSRRSPDLRARFVRRRPWISQTTSVCGASRASRRFRGPVARPRRNRVRLQTTCVNWTKPDRASQCRCGSTLP